jgi:hypothetical protein
MASLGAGDGGDDPQIPIVTMNVRRTSREQPDGIPILGLDVGLLQNIMNGI